MRINSIVSPNIYPKNKVSLKSNLPSSSASKYNPSFTSIPLYELTTIKEDENGIKTKIPVRFSEMSPKDIDDYRAMLGLRFEMRKNDVCGQYICESFISKPANIIHYFVIETEEKDVPLKKRILSLAEVQISDSPKNLTHSMEINYLQSLHANSSSKFKNTKGGGELCLYGLVKLAKEKNLDYIFLRSEQNGFYDHIKFGEKEGSSDNSTYYRIKNSSFDSFLKRVEEKYGLKAR